MSAEEKAGDWAISIHAPAKGATQYGADPCARTGFQSTLPRRERQTTSGRSWKGSRFQSTLPRRERRLTSTSTATEPHRFQSTLPRRERLDLDLIYEDLEQFQSTLPRRERRCNQGIFVQVSDISIHAPAKGATRLRSKSKSLHRFQSTLPRRERPEQLLRFCRLQRFQSTLPRRERQVAGRLN